MTAIAYRDGILAADTATWQGSVITGYHEKIVRWPGALFAAAGRKSDAVRVCEWLRRGCHDSERPALDKDGNFTAIFVFEGAVYRIETDCRPYRIDEDPYAAAGMCHEFMLGAMAAGATAEEAVRLAVQHTDGAAGEVQVERV